MSKSGVSALATIRLQRPYGHRPQHHLQVTAEQRRSESTRALRPYRTTRIRVPQPLPTQVSLYCSTPPAAGQDAMPIAAGTWARPKTARPTTVGTTCCGDRLPGRTRQHSAGTDMPMSSHQPHTLATRRDRNPWSRPRCTDPLPRPGSGGLGWHRWRQRDLRRDGRHRRRSRVRVDGSAHDPRQHKLERRDD